MFKRSKKFALSWKRIVLWLFCLYVFFLNSICSGQNTIKKKKVFRIDNYIFEVNRWGVISKIKKDGQTLFITAGIFSPGYYLSKSKEKIDRRLFQGKNEDSSFPDAVFSEDDKNIVIKREGIFGNPEYPKMIKYSEEIIIDKKEKKIHFSYTNEYLETIIWKGNGFVRFLGYIPISLLKGRGLVIELYNGEKQTKIIPFEWSKETNIHISNIKEVGISSLPGPIRIKADENTQITVNDTRSWGAKRGNLRFDIGVKEPWKRKTEIKKGTIKKYGFEIDF